MFISVLQFCSTDYEGWQIGYVGIKGTHDDKQIDVRLDAPFTGHVWAKGKTSPFKPADILDLKINIPDVKDPVEIAKLTNATLKFVAVLSNFIF